jgi:hypothetical protein
MPRTLRAAAILAAFIAGALIPACSNQEDAPTALQPPPPHRPPQPPHPPHPTPPPPTTAASPPTPEQEVSAAYLRAADAMARAFTTSDPDDPDLAETQTSPALDDLRKVLLDRQTDGQVLTYPGGTPPAQVILTVELTSESEAILGVCIVDNAQLVDRSTGDVLDDDVVSRHHEVHMVRAEGTWLIRENRLTSLTDGPTGCGS